MHERKEKTPITFKKGRSDEAINARQTALGQGHRIMLLLTNEPSFVKQTVKTNTLPSASRTTILELSDSVWNEWRQNKR